MPPSELAETIAATFSTKQHADQSTIPKGTVMQWMESNDIDALGALYGFVMDDHQAARIQPGLTFSECWALSSRYLEHCLRNDPDGEWVHSRYEAGWELARWILRLWTQGQPCDDLISIKEWMGHLYKTGDASLKRCLVDATLEHVFENRDIARLFGDWMKDPTLATAYSEAAEWSAKGGPPS